MATKTIKTRIVHKHDTEAHWNSAINFIPKQGEIIVYDIDSTYNYERFKIGDGETVVASLPFANQDIITEISRIEETIPKNMSDLTNNTGFITTEGAEIVVANHETNAQNHSDIRAAIGEINQTLTNFLNTDNTTLDQLNEIVTYITANRDLISSVTTNKINVTDIVDDLTTNMSNKVLSAKQGVMLNSSIQNISNQLTTFLAIDDTMRSNVTSLITYADTNKDLLIGRLTANNGEIFNDYTNNRATGAWSHAEGYKTSANGFAAHAEGNDGSTANGNYSHAEGNNTIAFAEGSHTEGDRTYAEIAYSHAEGGLTKSGGRYMHTEGYCTGGTGFAAHSEGGGDSEADRSAANGDYSHAEGLGSKIYKDGRCQHVQGRYNIIDFAGQYAHIVGNGEKEDVRDSSGKIVEYNRSNAHTLDWYGNAWFAGDVTVGPASFPKKLATMDDVAENTFIVGITMEHTPISGEDGAYEETLTLNTPHEEIKKAYAENKNIRARLTHIWYVDLDDGELFEDQVFNIYDLGSTISGSIFLFSFLDVSWAKVGATPDIISIVINNTGAEIYSDTPIKDSYSKVEIEELVEQIGTEVGNMITESIDNEMSDTSENAVQNKVVKAYIERYVKEYIENNIATYIEQTILGERG